MKKKIIGVALAVCVVAAGVSTYLVLNRPEPVEAESTKSFIDIANEDTSAVSPEVLSSSNPWDYVNEDYYNSIIEMGTDAIEPLTQLMESGELNGCYQYVSAVALEEITGCQLYNITGEDWSNIEQFYQLWDATMKSLPETLENIANDSDMSLDDKIAETEKYGIFGKAFAEKISEGEFECGDVSFKPVDSAELKEEYRQLGDTLDEDSVNIAMDYMNKKCK